MNDRHPLSRAALALAGTLLAASASADVLGFHSPMYLNMAERAAGEGRPARAIELLAPRAHTLRLAKERHRAYATLCRAYIDTEDFDSAEASCEQAAKGRVANWSDFNNRGVVRFRTGDHVGALQFFEKAASMNPKSEEVRKNQDASLSALHTTAPTGAARVPVEQSDIPIAD